MFLIFTNIKDTHIYIIYIRDSAVCTIGIRLHTYSTKAAIMSDIYTHITEYLLFHYKIELYDHII